MSLESKRDRWHDAFLSLGSNLGDKARQLETALQELELSGVRLEQASPLYVTEPVDFTEQDWFLNEVVKVSTQLNPLQLLETCMTIEQRLGRKRTVSKGPRTLDIDILFYDDLVLATEILTLPHPQLHFRRFVLEPLSILAPNWGHPVLNASISHLLEICQDKSEVLPFERWASQLETSKEG